MYISLRASPRPPRAAGAASEHGKRTGADAHDSVALPGWHYSSDATLSNTASFVVCVITCLIYQLKLLHGLPLSKKTCVRHVALDK